MALTYFKRYRMEVSLHDGWTAPRLPKGYRFVAWSADHIADHAATKYHSFRGEIDATIFTCLAEIEGCRHLVEEISDKNGFLPDATWLIEYVGVPHKPEYCGCIQGVKASPLYGAIQNVGVTPLHRGRGLGRALVEASLWGFRAAGLARAYLEVTTQNRPALAMYETMGFRRTKTLYKAIDLACA